MKILAFFLLIFSVSHAMARKTPSEMNEFNMICPCKERYIYLDRAYHECIKGFSNGSCDRFVDEIISFLPEYDCQRSFDKNYIVPAIWLAGAAHEDYTELLYKLASSNKFYKAKRFENAKLKAKNVFLSKEFANTLDGHLAEKYFPLIKQMRN